MTIRDMQRGARVVLAGLLIVTGAIGWGRAGNGEVLLNERMQNTLWPKFVEQPGSERRYQKPIALMVEGYEIPLRITWTTVVVSRDCHRVRDVKLERFGGARNVRLHGAYTERPNKCSRQPDGVMSEAVIVHVKSTAETDGFKIESGTPVAEINSEGAMKIFVGSEVVEVK